jgi:hypothetical protein
VEFRGAVRGLCARLKPIASGSYALNRAELFAGAAEPDMNVLILDTKFRGKLLDGHALVAGGSERSQDPGFQRAPPPACLGCGNPCRLHCGEGSGAAEAFAFSAPTDGRLGLSAGIEASHGRFNSPEVAQNCVTLFRELDKCLKS